MAAAAALKVAMAGHERAVGLGSHPIAALHLGNRTPVLASVASQQE